jgi:hypothetical protein
MHPRLNARCLRLAVIALLCLLPITSCKKKPPATDGDDAPAAIGSAPADVAVFIHVRPQDLFKMGLTSALKKQPLPFPTKADAQTWDEFDRNTAKEFGIQPSKVESITFGVVEVPENGKPTMIVIVACQTNIDQERLTSQIKKGTPKPSGRPGFTAIQDDVLMHFLDSKTMAIMSADLVDRYLAGYAKDRNGWPLTSSLRKAADEHTLLVVANLDKLPGSVKTEATDERVRKLALAKTAGIALDIKEKEIALNLRGDFSDDTAAGAAKDVLDKLIVEAKQTFAELPKQQETTVAKALEQAKRTLDNAKIERSGSNVTATARYTSDVSIGEILVGLLLPAVQKVRQAAERAQDMNNLKQMAIALNAENDAMGLVVVGGTGAKGLPIREPNEKALLSWRVALLPYMEEIELYNQFKQDEPWDSEHNKKLIDKMPKIFAVPGLSAPQGRTHYQMVVGPAALRPPLTIQGIRDGSSNTFAIVEAADPVIWTKPDDISIRGKTMPSDLKKKFGRMRLNGFFAAFFDGSVRLIDLDKTSDKALWSMITPDGKD